MLAIGFGVTMISILIIGISVLLIGLVLLQKNRGSGLSGAFGGVGGHSAFGTKTGDFLTWFTVGLATLFLVLCIAGNFMFEPEKPKVVNPVSTLSGTTPPAAGATAPAAGATAPAAATPAAGTPAGAALIDTTNGDDDDATTSD